MNVLNSSDKTYLCPDKKDIDADKLEHGHVLKHVTT